jgi:hypothetical protein
MDTVAIAASLRLSSYCIFQLRDCSWSLGQSERGEALIKGDLDRLKALSRNHTEFRNGIKRKPKTGNE